MRVLEKNKRSYHYANPTGNTIMKKDEEGYFSSEIEIEYEPVVKAKANYSSVNGEQIVSAFGAFEDYSIVMIFAGDCPLIEGSKLWIDSPIDKEADYSVKKVAKSLSGCLVALQRLP